MTSKPEKVIERPPLESFLKSPIQTEDLKSAGQKIWDSLRGDKGEVGLTGKDGKEGLPGKMGERGPRGYIGDEGKEGIQGPRGERGPQGERGFQGEEGRPGTDGKDGLDGKDGSPDSAKQILSKIHKSKEKLKATHIEGFDEVKGMVTNSARQVQSIISQGGSHQTAIKASGVMIGTGINTLNFLNASATKVGDGSEVSISISASATITPITIQGTINDSNLTFTSTTQPTLLCINGAFYQSTGGTITWTWVTGTITLSSPVGQGGSIFGI